MRTPERNSQKELWITWSLGALVRLKLRAVRWRLVGREALLAALGEFLHLAPQASHVHAADYRSAFLDGLGAHFRTSY